MRSFLFDGIHGFEGEIEEERQRKMRKPLSSRWRSKKQTEMRKSGSREDVTMPS
jgi:hypothetical protein